MKAGGGIGPESFRATLRSMGVDDDDDEEETKDNEGREKSVGSASTRHQRSLQAARRAGQAVLRKAASISALVITVL